MNQTIDLLTNHRSIRKFTGEPIDPALFQRLIEAGQAAASSSFLQGVTIMRVTDPDKRATFEQIRATPWYQRFHDPVNENLNMNQSVSNIDVRIEADPLTHVVGSVFVSAFLA